MKQRLFTVAFWGFSHVFAQKLRYVPPSDDSSRVIPVTLAGADGSTHDNHSAQICGTVSPAYGYRDRLRFLSNARRAERRGMNRRDSGLEDLRLESLYDVVDRDHEHWDAGEDLDDQDGESGLKRIVRRATSSPSITVETYFHIVSTRDQSKYYTSKVRDQIVNNQAIALNQAYRQVGVQFHMHPHSYTIRDDWATDAQSTNMKKALRQGKYSALNIYFQTNLTSGGPKGTTLLGYCTFPTNITYYFGGKTYEYPQSNWVTDGCNVLAASLPGSPVAVYGYDQGKTAIHEVGHWFGLLHTFQDNTCNKGATGDYVDDTPQESSSTVGCPKGKDSCTNLPGLDPITNFMDYSDDQWYAAFGQE